MDVPVHLVLRDSGASLCKVPSLLHHSGETHGHQLCSVLQELREQQMGKCLWNGGCSLQLSRFSSLLVYLLRYAINFLEK